MPRWLRFGRRANSLADSPPHFRRRAPVVWRSLGQVRVRRPRLHEALPRERPAEFCGYRHRIDRGGQRVDGRDAGVSRGSSGARLACPCGAERREPRLRAGSQPGLERGNGGRPGRAQQRHGGSAGLAVAVGRPRILPVNAAPSSKAVRRCICTGSLLPGFGSWPRYGQGVVSNVRPGCRTVSTEPLPRTRAAGPRCRGQSEWMSWRRLLRSRRSACLPAAGARGSPGIRSPVRACLRRGGVSWS